MARTRSKLPAERNPLWYKDAIFYEVRVGTFFDSDGDGIGDACDPDIDDDGVFLRDQPTGFVRGDLRHRRVGGGHHVLHAARHKLLHRYQAAVG